MSHELTGAYTITFEYSTKVASCAAEIIGLAFAGPAATPM